MADPGKIPSYVFNSICVVLFIVCGLVLITSYIFAPLKMPQTPAAPPPGPVTQWSISYDYYVNGSYVANGPGPSPVSSCITGWTANVTFNMALERTSVPVLYNYLLAEGWGPDSIVDLPDCVIECSAYYPPNILRNRMAFVAVIVASAMGLGALLVNACTLCSSSDKNINLGPFFCGTVCFCGAPLAIAIYSAVSLSQVEGSHTDAIIRMAFLFVCAVWAIFVVCCIYVSRITYSITTFWRTTTTYSDGSKYTSTSSDTQNFGYIKCRNWSDCC